MPEPELPHNDDIVSRADAFMRRRQRATPAAPAQEEDDLPVLTDVVTPSPRQDGRPTPCPDLDSMSQALAEAISKQLAAEIPVLVEASLQAALASIARDIRQGVEETSRKAIADFVASYPKPPR
ncbi:MAG: hypothetical protein WBH99_01160 [Azovibrio sp.]|uniref:hypothetical protein n=1 Tax=Azovibrio sp. TaxID=1872673 RepID=UPI003C73A984